MSQATNGHQQHQRQQKQKHQSEKMPCSNNKSASATESEIFDDTFKNVLDDLIGGGLKHGETGLGFEYLKKVLEYNVPFGKKNRGLSVVSSYERLVEKPTEENLKIARILGWCVELFQAYFLVTDDIMDNSITRRGMPCWYRKKEVGLIAVNDSYFIESCIYQLLKKHIRDKPYYMEVTELFLEMGFKTVVGQCLDMTTAPRPGEEVDFTHYTIEKYSAIVKWKTAYYSFYLPVAIAMYMAGITNGESHNQAKTVLLKIGHFFQVQDDYLDCFGTPEVIGKVGTDIQDNKCGWLIVKALELATDKQKAELKDNYGKWDDECVQKVKAIYRDLDLEGVYRKYEESSYRELIATMGTTLTQNNIPKDVFTDFMNKIYKRSK